MAGEFERRIIDAAGWSPDQVANAVLPAVAEPRGTPPTDRPPDLLSMLAELGLTPDGVLGAAMDGKAAPADTVEQRLAQAEKQILLLQAHSGALVPALRQAMTFELPRDTPGEF